MCVLPVCVCMLRICCIVLLLLLLPLVQPASSALFWSSLGHKKTTYLLARARLPLCLPLSFPYSLCVFVRECLFPARIAWQSVLSGSGLFVCLPACLLVGLAASSSPTFSQSSSHNFIQDKSVYHVLMPLSFYAAFFVPSFYYLFHFRNVN